MKPAAFEYECPETLDEALTLMAQEDAMALAGGQSLMPLLNFRMAAPEVLVDLNRVEELRQLSDDGDKLRIGAMVPHKVIEFDPVIQRRAPIMAEAMSHVAHLQVKTRGTLGGNLCNAHPASEMPAVLTALGAELHCRSSSGGARVIAAQDFFEGALENALDEGELLTEIHVPAQNPDHGWAFDEVTRRHGDFALGGAAVLIGARDGAITEASLVLCAVGDRPETLDGLQGWLVGQPIDATLKDRIEAAFAELHGDFEDASMAAGNKTRLLSALVARTVSKALTRVTGTQNKEAQA